MVQTESNVFRDRDDAGRRLSEWFRGRDLYDPVVLAIPRGGVAVGAALARELGAELDVVLSRKLRAPYQPEFAIGAVGEDGWVIGDRPQRAERFDQLLRRAEIQGPRPGR
ncbi:MAG TPA: hypothetical protein VGJ05_22685 [Fimbriiglobus sp.]|jgi:predicted phosphoribosyltransferase